MDYPPVPVAQLHANALASAADHERLDRFREALDDLIEQHDLPPRELARVLEGAAQRCLQPITDQQRADRRDAIDAQLALEAAQHRAEHT